MGEFSNKYLVNKPSGGGKKNSMQDEVMQSLRARRREKVAEIRDTDSRMPKAQRDRVNSLEKAIRDRETEKAYIVGQNGEILAESIKAGISHRGGKMSKSAVFNTGDVMRAALNRDAIITHNHPATTEEDFIKSYKLGRGKTGASGKDLAGRVGSGLSADDLMLAMKYNFKGIRAHTQGGYTFQVERKGDSWGYSSDSVAREYARLVAKYTKENFDSKGIKRSNIADVMMKRGIGMNVSKEEMDKAMAEHNRANTAAQHRALKELAKKYNLRYTRHS